MSIFHLPDLGEGLAEAEIHEWYVKVGDEVKVDQPLVSVETAKALVDIPSPESGRIVKLYGQPGEFINTHAPLLEFSSDNNTNKNNVNKDKGSVVGQLEESDTILKAEENIEPIQSAKTSNIKVMPAVRVFANKHNINLATVKPTGTQGQITIEDVEKLIKPDNTPDNKEETLHGVRHFMAIEMARAHQEVVNVTLVDEADITSLPDKTDITVSLIQAIITGIKAEPVLNVWYDGKIKKRILHNAIHLGLAMDTAEGLFVPVLKNILNQSPKDLRTEINRLKKSVQLRTIAKEDLQGATFTLSNFGVFAGRYATVMVVPPAVGILGCGRIRECVRVHEGKIAIRRIMPLSLSFDHRVVTGGEASRFLAAMMAHLEGRDDGLS